MGEIISYIKSDNLLDDVCSIIESARQYAYKTVDTTLVLRNWYIGKRIDEEVLKGKERAEYGSEVIDKLSKNLTGIYGKGYSKRILYQCLRVFRMFPEIVNEARAQLNDTVKVNEVGSQFGLLSWTHYRILTQIEDYEGRKWYAKEAFEQTWRTTTLQRNINTQYYYRLLKTQDKDSIKKERQELT